MSTSLVLDKVVLKMARDKVRKMFKIAKMHFCFQVMKQTAGNYPAPLKILDVIRTGLVNGPTQGYAAEAKAGFYNFFKNIFLQELTISRAFEHDSGNFHFYRLLF